MLDKSLTFLWGKKYFCIRWSLFRPSHCTPLLSCWSSSCSQSFFGAIKSFFMRSWTSLLAMYFLDFRFLILTLIWWGDFWGRKSSWIVLGHLVEVSAWSNTKSSCREKPFLYLRVETGFSTGSSCLLTNAGANRLRFSLTSFLRILADTNLLSVKHCFRTSMRGTWSKLTCLLSLTFCFPLTKKLTSNSSLPSQRLRRSPRSLASACL
mmetsp:Transcript_9774/g.14579  ORF Transcript_9774/g.14579 Transcript_9774/m.14579 type:complete len:208 (-) Transcript_9774:329-952(-)